MIKICTKYRKSDSTLTAIGIHDLYSSLGNKVEIYAYSWRAKHVNTFLDNKIKKAIFDTLINNTKIIIWTVPVDSIYIEEAKQENIKNIFYTSWEDLEPYYENVLFRFNKVIVPTPLQALKFKEKFKLKNITVIPYYCHLPITHQPQLHIKNHIKLCLPLYGIHLKRIDTSIITILINLLIRADNVSVSFIYDNGLTSYTSRLIKKYKARFGDRINIYKKLDWDEQLLTIAEHDLVIYPAKFDGFCTLINSSLKLGVPVVTWNVSPMNEFIHNNENGILIDCGKEENWLGLEKSLPNYGKLEETLINIIRNPDELCYLKHNIHIRQKEQVKYIIEEWSKIINNVK